MNLSSFSENIVTVPYTRSGETVNMEINIDAFTPEFFRHVGKKFEEKMTHLRTDLKPKANSRPKSRAKNKSAEDVAVEQALAFFENEAVELEVKRQIHAELLSNGVLKGWDLNDDDGKPLAVSYDVLVGLPPLLVEHIWNLCLKTARTVKKRAEEEDEETLENTPNGSRAPLALAPTG
jgi:hypothetical protein